MERGADVNAQGGAYVNALHAAAYHRRQVIMELLLDQGADVNAQGGSYGNALQAAAYRGHEAMARLMNGPHIRYDEVLGE